MGTDRHHEEHEAWCVLRRQKKNLSTELAEHSNRLFVATLIISDSMIAYFHSDKIACFHYPTKADAVDLLPVELGEIPTK